MSAQTVITHALNQGARMRYVGTQSWDTDMDTVTVIKPWGGHHDPLYVVIPDGMDARFTYVVAESQLRPLVSLAKVTDRDVPAPAPRVRGEWLLKRNDLDLFADWLGLTLSRARRLGHVV